MRALRRHGSDGWALRWIVHLERDLGIFLPRMQIPDVLLCWSRHLQSGTSTGSVKNLSRRSETRFASYPLSRHDREVKKDEQFNIASMSITARGNASPIISVLNWAEQLAKRYGNVVPIANVNFSEDARTY